MKIINNIAEIKEIVKAAKTENKTIGLVPTMGYLHEGHISLANMSIKQNDITIMSIFVNPTQFGPNEDYDSYPRDLERDAALAEKAGVDYIFAPAANEMYQDNYSSFVDVEKITDHLCGASRPGHFRGVATVVLKLFNISEADNAYFGQKDYQQVLVIKRMVSDLNVNINIVMCPIVRESNGLAKSSRNTYLTKEQETDALLLNQSLSMAQMMVKQGETKASVIREMIIGMISSSDIAKIDYVSIVNPDTLLEAEMIVDGTVIALAVKFGTTRLIDNIILEV